MQVEYSVLKRTYDIYKAEYEEAALRVLRSGWYILGKEMEKFEEQFANFLGVKHCIAVNSGTDALIMSLRALGIKEGDEVIVPANAYIASVIGVTENRARPIFVDADVYMGMDVSEIELKITEKTKAILPVHLFGQPNEMGQITEIAKRHGLFLIEDCAQCHGSRYNGRLTGTFGAVGCFSFYPTKPLGALGDAGALVTDDDVLAEKLRLLRNYGSKVKYHNEINGINSRMDEVQAAILQVGLRHMEEGNEERNRLAQKYIRGIHNKKVRIPPRRENATHVYHLFPILVEDRQRFCTYLADNGVKTQIHYPIPPYVAKCYKDWGYQWSDYPNAEMYANREVSLPIYAGMPEREVEYVIRVINEFK